MQSTSNAEQDRTFEVTPEISHTVPWRVVSTSALADSRLRVTFVDGTTGDVDMGAFLNNRGLDGTLFEALRDPAIFYQARVVLGTVQWPNGADLAPDTMYDAIREHSVWVVE